MSGPLLGLPAAVADVQDKLGRVQTAGGWAGAEFDGCVLEDGKVKLIDSLPIADSRVTDNSVAEIHATSWAAGKFVSGENVSVISVTSKLSKSGTIAANLEIHIYSEGEGNPLSSLGFATIAPSELDTGLLGTEKTVTITPSSPLVKGKTYFVVWRTPGGDSTNKFRVRLHAIGTGGNRYNSVNSGSSWAVETSQAMWFLIESIVNSTTSTATLDISPTSLYAWRNLYFKSKKPANTGVSCKVVKNIDEIKQLLDTDVSSINSPTYFWAESFITGNYDFVLDKIRLKLRKNVGSPTTNIQVEIRTDDGAGKPSATKVGDTAVLNANVLTTTNQAYDFSVNASLTKKTRYHFVIKTDGTGVLDTSNSFYVVRSGIESYFDGNISQSPNSGSTWSTIADYDFYFELIPLEQILIPSITDGGDLSSIDPTQYKTLRLVWTLTRNSVEDESPVVYEPFWSWLGGETADEWLSGSFVTGVSPKTSHQANNIVDIEGSGYLISIVLTTTTSTILAFQIDGGEIYEIVSPTPIPLFLRFNRSLKITCSQVASSRTNAWVVLD